MNRLDPVIVLQQIANLKAAYPEIEEDEQLLHDMLQGSTDAHEFLTVVVDRLRDAAAMAGGVAGRIAELEIRQKRFERREQAMRDLAFKVMSCADLKKVELAEATLSIRNGTQKIVITSEDEIPKHYCTIKYAPNRAAIKELLLAGVPVSGAVLSNAEPSLSVRVK